MALRLVIIMLITSSLSFAAALAPTPAPSSTMSISEIIKRGLEYSPDVQRADGAVKEATGNLDKARGLFFPTVSGTASGTNAQHSTTSSTATVPGTVSSTSGDTYVTGLTLTQPLYAGGALTGGLSLYKANEDVAKQNYFLAKETLLGSLLSAYYTLVQAEMTLEAAQANCDILKAYVEITARYAHIGRARKMDELQAQANYSLGIIDREQQANSLAAAQANVNRYIGEPRSFPVKSNYKVTINPIGNLGLQDALETAVKNNPTLIGDKIKVEIVDYTKQVDLSQDMPSLSFTGTFGYQAPDVPDMYEAASQYYSAGLTLTVPIFSGLTSFAKRRIYAAQTYEAEKQLQSDRDSIRVLIESALDSIRSTQAQLDVAVRSVKEARAGLDLANKGYREGTAAPTDVINLQVTRYTAEKGFITAQFAYLSALLTLRQNMGIDLEKAYAH